MKCDLIKNLNYSNKKNLFFTLFIVMTMFISGCSNSNQGLPAANTAEDSLAETLTVEITTNGFNPSSLTTKKGSSVAFVNKDSQPHWPASAMHPTHTVYPGSDIKKCKMEERATIFDACGSLQQEEKYSFVFNEVGSWKYHDHLNPSSTGTIVVE